MIWASTAARTVCRYNSTSAGSDSMVSAFPLLIVAVAAGFAEHCFGASREVG